jgi:hypothetical protein
VEISHQESAYCHEILMLLKSELLMTLLFVQLLMRFEAHFYFCGRTLGTEGAHEGPIIGVHHHHHLMVVGVGHEDVACASTATPIGHLNWPGPEPLEPKERTRTSHWREAPPT